jgi:hypothetical protein
MHLRKRDLLTAKLALRKTILLTAPLNGVVGVLQRQVHWKFHFVLSAVF